MSDWLTPHGLADLVLAIACYLLGVRRGRIWERIHPGKDGRS